MVEAPATAFSVALLGEFIALGVRDVVLSPGSRSQALALAAAEYERAGHIRLRVRIDERVSGFLALGIAAESGMPTLVITTSGSAVANLHPAVLEAHHAGVPMILLTADRPPELRGIGANQTTDQLGIFGAAVHFVREVEPPASSGFAPEYPGELAREALSAALGRSGRRGPAQIDLGFREPLSTALTELPDIPSRPAHAPATPDRAWTLADAAGAVVIAGDKSGPRAEEFARQIGAPLIAEVSSGARFGPNLVVAYRSLLADPEYADGVERAIVFGHPTLTREVPALLQRDGVDVTVVRGVAGEDYNPGRRAARIVDAVEFTGESAPRAWAGRWVSASRALLHADAAPTASSSDPRGSDRASGTAGGGTRDRAQFSREQLTAFREPVDRRMLVDAVWRMTWPHDRLVLGASRLIRELDRMAPGKRIPVHANRGLAGIDGTIGTAIGIALAAEAGGATGTTRVLVGDLTLLHDVGSLLFGGGEQRPRIQVIVGNDGGGTIFDGLEVAGSAPRELRDRVLFTPQSVDLAALAAAYGWRYLLATNRGELDEALTATDAATIVEVPIART